MSVWSQPNTEEKSNQLACLMKNKIVKKNACNKLYDILGDDILHNAINSLPAGTDVRVFVKIFLASVIDDIPLSEWVWENKAIEICKEVLNFNIDDKI